jgi:predicted RND superfamily exporter protein
MNILSWIRKFLAKPRLRMVVLFLALTSALPAGRAMVDLYANLNSDLEALLPADSPAVRGVKMLRQRMEGSQHLGIVIRSASDGPPLRFATELGKRLRAYAATRPDLIRSVRTDVVAERQFIHRFGPLYIPFEDLREIRQQVASAVMVQRGGLASLMPMFGGTPDPQKAVAELKERVQRQDPFAGRFPGDRLVTNDGRMAVVLVLLATTDTGVDTIGPLVDHIKHEVASLAPDASGVEVGYAGDVAIAVEELSALKADIGVSAVLVLVGIAALIVLYFRWWGALPAIAIPLGIGTAWGFGVASFFVRSLCSSTAFLGSIVVGNGINSGIILTARYTDERRRGAAPAEAVLIAMQATWPATLAATLAASVGYASLMTTTFRGFNEFAVIGSIGMLACWLATYLLLPITLLLFDRRACVADREPGLGTTGGAWIEHLVVHRPRTVMLAGGLVLVASLAAISQFNSSRIEYDMSKLRSRDSAIHGEGYWSRQMDTVLGRNFTSVALMAQSTADAQRIAASLREAATHEPLASITSSVITPDDAVPPDQDRRRQELRKIRQMLTPAILATFPEAAQAPLESLAAGVDAPELTSAALPELLALGLREKDGQFGRTSLLLQSLNGSTWNGALTIQAAMTLRHIASSVQPPAEIAGGFFVSAEILEALKREALPTTLASFAGVVLVVVMLFRARRQSVMVLAALLVGVTLLAGSVILLNIRINFLNFMAFPITFGIGVEYAINVLQRYRENPTDVPAIVSKTGSAVALCSFTTILGYGSLLQASNQALFSFGVIAVLGEVMCLLTAILLLPAALSSRSTWGISRSGDSENHRNN